MKPRHILSLLAGWWVLLFHNKLLALIVLVAVCVVVIAVCLVIRLMDTPLDEHYNTVPRDDDDFQQWEQELKPTSPNEGWST